MPRSQHRIVRVGDLLIDPARFEVRAGKRAIQLTRTESQLLRALASRTGRVFARRQLIKLVWGKDVHVQERTVDAHILRLRAKLKRFGKAWPRLDTVWGSGYRLRIE